MDSELAAAARNAWTRLESWCKQHHPRLLGQLNPGASDQEIAAAERSIGQVLPDDVRESLEIHNGTSSLFVFNDALLAAAGIAEEWASWREADGSELFRHRWASEPPDAITLGYANPGWVPLAADRNGNYLGIDLAPDRPERSGR
ncbi:SMI1/KNR4 family protein [bacterium]|nr:SMI1/KNR4 family protein [bacterium]